MVPCLRSTDKDLNSGEILSQMMYFQYSSHYCGMKDLSRSLNFYPQSPNYEMAS
jgi:hypothetical protein